MITVLVVDDDRDVAESLGMVLEGLSCRVDLAFSGGEAVRRYREARYDLVLMDVRMPAMNGVEAFLEIRGHDPDAKVMMMTGYSVEQLLDTAIHGGALGVLRKPIDLARLRRYWAPSGPRETRRVSTDAADRRRMVLVVDDEVDFAVSIADILSARGYDVAIAHSADEFWKAREGFPAQVVLTDVRLGRSDGIDLIAEIIRTHPETICVVMTAYATADSAIQAIHEGAYDYLRKPLQIPDLLATLDRGFEKLALQRERRRLQEQLTEARRLQEVAKLTRAVAHETQNPLFAISSGLQLLQGELEPILNEEQRYTLETLFQETMRVSRLVDELVSYGEIKEYRRAPVQLCDVVAEVANLHRGWCDSRGLRIEITAASEQVPEVPVDRDKIVQVLLNLLKNALEVSDSGDTVELVCGMVDGVDQVSVEVRDRGPGIPPMHRDRVFDLFFSTKQDGRGMGLAISQKIVVDHEGDIQLLPREGGGTVARLVLPF